MFDWVSKTKDRSLNVSKFWKMLCGSVLTTCMIALALVGTICYLWVIGRDVPILLAVLVIIVVLGSFVSK